MSRIRVVVADDEPGVLEILAEVVRSGEDGELVGTARDASEAAQISARQQPDVAVLDVKMPGGGGHWATREIRSTCPETKVVALSAFGDKEAVLEMLRAGAVGYLVKGARVEEILESIRGAARGEAPLPPRWPPTWSSSSPIASIKRRVRLSNDESLWRGSRGSCKGAA